MKSEFSRVNDLLTGASFFVCMLIMSTSAQVLINELMPSNTQTYADIWDFEDFPDWIELYNSSTAQVDLSGYYLSDDFNNLKLWPFPSGTKIPAGGYLIVIADGYDTKPGQTFTRDFYPWNVKFQTKNYHTNFKLSSDGEKIALSKDNGGTVTIIDSVSFSSQFSDISVGRNPSGNSWGAQFDLPTPGAANSDPKKADAFSEPVSFSIVGGFYDAAQTVTLSVSAGDIYYTTDGSIPDKRSQKYSSPITISSTTSLRARCVESGKFAGKTVTNTYFIGEKKRSLMVINLATESEWLYNKDNGVFENSLKGRELPVAMEFFTTEGKQIVKVNAGMRLGSLTNFTCPQKPMQVALKGGKYGDDFIWNQLFDKPVANFVGLRLRQGGDAWGSNLIADGLLESICRNQLDVGYQAYRPVVVYINGKYYGIQDLREQFDDQYFISNYNVDPTSKQEVRTILVPPNGKEGWELVSGSWDTWQAVINYVKKESMTDDTKYKEIKSQVNINSLIDYVALQEFGCNVSWGHNEDIWKTEHTKWQWLVTDFDRCFINTTYGNVKTDILNSGGSGLSKSIMAQDTLFGKLMNNAEFKAYAIQRMAAHLNSTFKPERIHAFIDSIVTTMTPEMDEYINAWKSENGALQSVEAWKKDIDSVKAFITDRPQYVFQHLSNTKFAPSGTAELTITLSDTKGGEIYINEVRMNQGLSAMKFFKDIPMELRAVAFPGYVFSGWSEGGNGTDSLALTLSVDKTLQAKFEKAEDHVIPSTISENTTFNLTDHPYVGNGDIKVAKGVTLTIEKGVTVLMSQNANIRIDGRLLINGTADAQVTITFNESAGVLNWGAINFYSTDTSKMTYVKISGTTLGSDALNERAGINGNNSNVIMDHLTVSNVVYPFYFEYGTTALKNSSITIDHICNGGIHIGRGGALVENNYWVSTGKTINTDAIDIKGVTDGIIRGNRLYNFNGFNSDGIDLGEGAKNITIEGNYIYGNRDKGISVGGGSTCIVKNNIIVGCDLGIGIKDEGSKAELDHNTFVRNRIAVATYTKVFGRGGGTAIVKNCILAASQGPSYYTDQFSSATFSYCLSDKEALEGTGNICTDAGFTDLLGFNFQLMEGSPCINTGDPSGPKDSDGSVTDIGVPYTYNKNDFPSELTIAYKPSVVINELMTDDSKDKPSGDWIELYNPTSAPIAIGNWKIAKNKDIEHWENIIDIASIDSSKFFTIPENTTLSANGFIVLCKNLTDFKAAYPDVNNCIGDIPFGMDNKETILLFNNMDSLVNSVSYADKKPWINPQSGISYELKKATMLNYLPSNWGVSKKGGTPGGVNVATPIIERISQPVLPTHFFLAQNYPNPFRLTTTINFAMPQAEHVTISIYNFAGRLVKTLLNSEMDAGYHKISWNAHGYSPGVYIYKIQSGSFMQSKKVTIQ
ncbi:MAG TPA: lamin tail domain-containing protein [Chitinispirillaceae bacterium]|nr:lamin tail domain-containing protein [Chitinispirillaceae bacterium]